MARPNHQENYQNKWFLAWGLQDTSWSSQSKQQIWQLRTLNTFGTWSKSLAQGGSRTIQFFQKLNCVWWCYLLTGLPSNRTWNNLRDCHVESCTNLLGFNNRPSWMYTLPSVWGRRRSNESLGIRIWFVRVYMEQQFAKLMCFRKTEIWNAHYAVSLLPVLSHDGQSNLAPWLHVDMGNVKRSLKMSKGMHWCQGNQLE